MFHSDEGKTSYLKNKYIINRANQYVYIGTVFYTRD